tara:strand:+ start:5786 stop:5938 length:153 start_codon:yes stop_codon:yes gene_type:complete
MTNREKYIKIILDKSGDEFESTQDYINLAIKTDSQLIKEIIKINNYLLNN